MVKTPRRASRATSSADLQGQNVAAAAQNSSSSPAKKKLVLKKKRGKGRTFSRIELETNSESSESEMGISTQPRQNMAKGNEESEDELGGDIRSGTARKSSAFTSLPAHLTSEICVLLERKDILSLSMTCHSLRTLVVSIPGCWRKVHLKFLDDKLIRFSALTAIAPFVQTLEISCRSEGQVRLAKTKFRSLPLFQNVSTIQMSSNGFRGGETSLFGILAERLPSVNTFQYKIAEVAPNVSVPLIRQTWPSIRDVELDAPEPLFYNRRHIFDAFHSLSSAAGEAELLTKLSINCSSYSENLSAIWSLPGVQNRLKMISLRSPICFNISGMGGISQLKALTELVLEGRYKHCRDDLAAFSRLFLEVVRDIATLKRLILIGNASSNETDWTAVFGGAKFSLTSLSLTMGPALSRETAEVILSTQTALEAIRLVSRNPGAILPEDVKQVLKSLPKLKRLTTLLEIGHPTNYFSWSDEEAVSPVPSSSSDDEEGGHGYVFFGDGSWSDMSYYSSDSDLALI